MPNPLRSLLIIPRLGVKNIVNVLLRVPIIKREQRRLHLQHNLVSRQKHVIHLRQPEVIQQRLVSRNRLRMLKARPVAAAENVSSDRQFVAAHRGVVRIGPRIHVDHLYHPIAVGPAGRSVKIHHRPTGQVNRRRQRLRNKRQHVRPSVHKALIVHQPRAPRVSIIRYERPWRKRHWLGWV